MDESYSSSSSVSQLTLSKNRDFWFGNVAGALCLLGYASLAWYSKGSLGEPSLTGFFLLIACVSVPMLAVFIGCSQGRQIVSFQSILIWAILFRLCGVVGEPLFEDDYYRYLWDGYRFATDGSPYVSTPASFFSDESVPLVFQRILDQINYPDIPTIYGPTTQFLFLASYWLSPGTLLPLKVALISLDVGLIWLLRKVAKPHFLLLYAWCPLVLKEIAFTCHPDVVGIVLLIVALLLHKRGFLTWAAVCLALAVGAKIFAVFFVPFVLLNKDIASKLAFVGTLGFLYLPIILQGQTDWTALWIFANEWVFNSSMFAFATIWLEPTTARLLLGATFVLLLSAYWFRYLLEDASDIPRGDWIFGVFLVFAPTVNPWYVLWILPFAVIYPTWWAWIAAYSVMLSYVTWINLGNFELDPFSHPEWVKPLEYGLIAVALLMGLFNKHYKSVNSSIT